MSGSAKTGRPVILITIPPMIDSEFGRFLLVHYRVPHVEEPHSFFFSFFHTLLHGRTLAAPVAYTDAYSVVSPKGIIDHFDKLSPLNLQLLRSNNAAETARITADMDRFNGDLAKAMAQYAYGVLLPHREIMIGPLTRGCPWWEVRTVRIAFPVFAGTLRLLLMVSPETIRTALVLIRTVMDEVAARLADGASYLVGDRLSLSDVAFATAAAPLVMPENNGSAAPGFDELPSEMKALVTEFRGHPAGQFVQRIYRDWRLPSVGRNRALDA